MPALPSSTFNAASNRTRLAATIGASADFVTEFSYDHLQRMTGIQQHGVSGGNAVADYAYDDRGQLTGSQYDYQGDEPYSYDANGNRTNIGYSTGDNNQLLSDGTYNYQYDAEGNRIKKTEIANGEATEYHWDHRNRLVSVVHRDALGVPLQTVDYVYDLFDRRIGKSDTPASGPTEVETYVYDGAHVALRFIDGQLANRYLHGPAIDQILADEQVDSLSSSGEVLWPLTDHLGTVRDLAAYDGTTDTTSVVNHIAYDAFGRVTSQSNAAVDHLFGYTGREWDSAVDLQYNRARWYDPAIGRWLSEDPIGFAAGDANLSRYVSNQPKIKTDPSGMLPPFNNDPFDLFPPLPPSGPVTEPGLLDAQDYFEDLLKDLLEEEAKKNILDPWKNDIWDPWWDDRNPFQNPSDPFKPQLDRPRRPDRDRWWDYFKPDRFEVRPKLDGIKVEFEWIGDSSCPNEGNA